MSQKQQAETSRRDALLEAALPLFLENGYEKTSMRMIAGKVGCEVGLVYYYFATKEDIFENAIALYFDKQKNALIELQERANGDANALLDALFVYLEKEAPVFAETFHAGVHWTVRCAVRSKFVETVRPYAEDIAVRIAKESRSVPYPTEFAAKTVSESLVHAALDMDKTYFSAHKDDLRRLASHLLGTDKNTGRKRDIPSFLL